MNPRISPQFVCRCCGGPMLRASRANPNICDDCEQPIADEPISPPVPVLADTDSEARESTPTGCCPAPDRIPAAGGDNL